MAKFTSRGLRARALLRKLAKSSIRAIPTGNRRRPTGARFKGTVPSKPAPAETRFHRPWDKHKPFKVKTKFAGGTPTRTTGGASIRGGSAKVPRKAIKAAQTEHAARRAASIQGAAKRVQATHKAVAGAYKWTGRNEPLAMRKSAALAIRSARTTSTGRHKGASVRGTKAVGGVGLRRFTRVAGPVKGGITFQGRHYAPSLAHGPVRHGRVIGVSKRGGKFSARVKGRIGDEAGLKARLASNKLIS